MSDESLQKIVTTIGIPVAKRHIFLCAEQTKPKCCDYDRGVAAARKELGEAGFDAAWDEGRGMSYEGRSPTPSKREPYPCEEDPTRHARSKAVCGSIDPRRKRFEARGKN